MILTNLSRTFKKKDTNRTKPNMTEIIKEEEKENEKRKKTEEGGI